MIFNKIRRFLNNEDFSILRNELDKKLSLCQNLIYDLHKASDYQNKWQRVSLSLNKGILSKEIRSIDITEPLSWEFSVFSQNGEDGIIDYLLSKLKKKNKYFIEVGASDGIECNSAYLAYVKGFSGVMIDGDSNSIKTAESIMHNLGVEYVHMFVNLQNLIEIKNTSLFLNPDVISWDTDGNDYFFVKKMFDIGFRPKIFVVEYNSVYGPEKELSVTYNENFDFKKMHDSHLYYGCSIGLWKKLFNNHNYEFISVDSKGVNAFFVDKNEFESDFLNNISGTDFNENFFQLSKFRVNWEKQFELIKHLDFTES
jgi:hypothetical protein